MVLRPEATSNIVPTRTRTMLRMKASAVLWNLNRRLEARDLSECMHAHVRPPRHGQLHLLAQHSRQRRLEFALHGPQPRLLRPAAEAAPVVFDVQPDRGHEGGVSPGS